MSSWNRICCAMDFAEPSRLALVEAADAAKRSGGELTIVHAWVPPYAALGAMSEVPAGGASLIEEVRSDLSGQLEAARNEAERITGTPVSARLLEGEPGGEVPRFARETGQDLIVVATHGRTGLKRLMLGSVAEKIVREAPCSVLVVRATGSSTGA